MQENVIYDHMSVILDISLELGKNIVFITQNYNLQTYDPKSVFYNTGSRSESFPIEIFPLIFHIWHNFTLT